MHASSLFVSWTRVTWSHDTCHVITCYQWGSYIQTGDGQPHEGRNTRGTWEVVLMSGFVEVAWKSVLAKFLIYRSHHLASLTLCFINWFFLWADASLVRLLTVCNMVITLLLCLAANLGKCTEEDNSNLSDRNQTTTNKSEVSQTQRGRKLGISYFFNIAIMLENVERNPLRMIIYNLCINDFSTVINKYHKTSYRKKLETEWVKADTESLLRTEWDRGVTNEV